MKIYCECGSFIHDGTDDLPNKAHLIPDESWCAMWDALEERVIDAVATGRMNPERASVQAREIVRSAGLRPVWQCEACGRLYMANRGGLLDCFVPSPANTTKRVLRRLED